MLAPASIWSSEFSHICLQADPEDLKVPQIMEENRVEHEEGAPLDKASEDEDQQIQAQVMCDSSCLCILGALSRLEGSLSSIPTFFPKLLSKSACSWHGLPTFASAVVCRKLNGFKVHCVNAIEMCQSSPVLKGLSSAGLRQQRPFQPAFQSEPQRTFFLQVQTAKSQAAESMAQLGAGRKLLHKHKHDHDNEKHDHKHHDDDHDETDDDDDDDHKEKGWHKHDKEEKDGGKDHKKHKKEGKVIPDHPTPAVVKQSQFEVLSSCLAHSCAIAAFLLLEMNGRINVKKECKEGIVPAL